MRDVGQRSRQSSKQGLHGIFPTLCKAAALLVTLIIGSAVCAIVVGGWPSLPEALASDEVRFSIGLSLSTAGISTALCFLLSLPAAYALVRTSMPFKRVANVLLELTLSLPYILLGLALLAIFSSDFGRWLKSCGFAVVFQPVGIVVAQLIVNLPFAIRMVRTGFLDLDPRLEMIARSLGATPFMAFLTVTLPMVRNQLVSTFILTWSRAMGEFGATLMLVGVTRMKTETLPGSIYLNISVGNNELAMSTAIVMLLISAGALAVSNLLTRQRPQALK